MKFILCTAAIVAYAQGINFRTHEQGKGKLAPNKVETLFNKLDENKDKLLDLR